MNGAVAIRREVTETRINTFLDVLAETGSKTAAARAATPWSTDGKGGLTSFRQEALRNPDFARRWREAEERALGRVEAEIVRRAFTPTKRPVVSNGQVVAYELTYDNRLLVKLAAALDPSRWSQSANVTVRRVPDRAARADELLVITNMTREERAEMRELMSRAKEMFDRVRRRVEQPVELTAEEVSDHGT